MAGREVWAASPKIRIRQAVNRGAVPTRTASTRRSAKAAKAESRSSSVAAERAYSCKPRRRPVGSMSSRGVSGSKTNPTVFAVGIRSRRSSSRFACISLKRMFTPVTLAPGRLRLETSPIWIGSSPLVNTTGIVDNPFTDPVAEGFLQGKAPPPSGAPEGLPFAIHHTNLTESGIYQIQNANLGALAQDKVWVSCTIILPLRAHGNAVGQSVTSCNRSSTCNRGLRPARHGADRAQERSAIDFRNSGDRARRGAARLG